MDGAAKPAQRRGRPSRLGRGCGCAWQLAHQTPLHERGSFELIVRRGEYTLLAIADGSGHGLFDMGESAAKTLARDATDARAAAADTALKATHSASSA